MKSAKRQTRIRIGSRNWTTICFVGLLDCWSTGDYRPRLDQPPQQSGCLSVGRGIGGPGLPAVLCASNDAGVHVEQQHVGELLVVGRLDDRAERHLLARRAGPDRAQHREEQDRQPDRGGQQEGAERILRGELEDGLQHLEAEGDRAAQPRRGRVCVAPGPPPGGPGAGPLRCSLCHVSCACASCFLRCFLPPTSGKERPLSREQRVVAGGIGVAVRSSVEHLELSEPPHRPPALEDCSRRSARRRSWSAHTSNRCPPDPAWPRR